MELRCRGRLVDLLRNDAYFFNKVFGKKRSDFISLTVIKEHNSEVHDLRELLALSEQVVVQGPLLFEEQ